MNRSGGEQGGGLRKTLCEEKDEMNLTAREQHGKDGRTGWKAPREAVEMR